MIISIITVCFNSENTIKKTLESIQAQTYKNFELIVVDGESTDKTLEIIREYNDIIDIIISEKDNGVYDAMNKGIQAAKGDVIGFLNSDDFFYDQNILENIANEFINSDIDCSYGDMYYVNRFDTAIIKRKWVSGKFYKNYLKDGWIPGHPTFYLKKEIYTRVGTFNLNFKLAADYELMLRVLTDPRIKVKYHNHPQVVMRLGGLTSKNFSNRIKQNKEIYDAWKVNNIKPGYFFFLRRLIIKLKQLYHS